MDADYGKTTGQEIGEGGCWWEQLLAAVGLPARAGIGSCAKTVRPRQPNGGKSDLVINNETGKVFGHTEADQYRYTA